VLRGEFSLERGGEERIKSERYVERILALLKRNDDGDREGDGSEPSVDSNQPHF
jgi:hypothetical protein